MADGDLKINEAVIKQLLNDIYSSNNPNKRALFKETFRHLFAGVLKGYDKDFTTVKYNTPDFKMLNDLGYNVGVFSIFKNHDFIKETVKLLKNDDGTLRTKKEFVTEARKLNDKYNKRYLATEYDHAISAARMAAKWQEFERTKHLYPNLQYIAVMDERTRQLHRNWHGLILPIDHKFWRTHFPPNDWGCRCTARRTDKAVDDKGVDVDGMPNLPKQFNINVGIEGKVFDDTHPYFKIPEFKTVAYFALTSLLRYQTQNYYTLLKSTFLKPVKTEVGGVVVHNKAIKEALNQPHKNGWLKNNLMLKLSDVLKDAFYIGSSASKKGSAHWKQYHYLRLKDFDNMIVIIREDYKGNLFFYSITENAKL